MRAHIRPFDIHGSDFEKMWRFLQEDYGHKQDRYIWHCSRLGDWRYGLWNEEKYLPSFFGKHAQLWVDGFDDLLGWVLSEDGGNIFYIFARRGFEYLYADILDWTIREWGPRYASLKTEVHEHQDEALAQLERKGFHSLGVAATTRQYDLRAKADEPVTLPPGFRIVDMAANGDYRRKGLLYVNGFQDKDEASEFELLRFEYSRENPAYDPGLDFSVIAPDGAHAASCVGFADPASRAAEVEKVCTHSAYRRLGLAEAVIRECFHRLHARGIETAYITGYGPGANALYEQLGPCNRKQWFHYELEA